MDNKASINSKIRIKIGSSKFSATLEDNITANAFKALLPMTINMTELNGNEKYFNLSNNLPTHLSNPSTIQKGDPMIYGASTVVLSTKRFQHLKAIQNSGAWMIQKGLIPRLVQEE